MIEFKDVSLVYPNGTQGLKNVNLTINPGEFVVIVGLSGAGKSTLIRSMNRLVTPTSGELLIENQNILNYRSRQLRQLRTKVGMIFQNYNLVKRSSVMKNVISGRLGHTGTLRSLLNLYPKEDLALAYRSLQRVNISEKVYQRADQLSGGQQQRVAIARVLTQQPNIILADEPVASLDPPTSHQVMTYLRKVNKEDKITTIVNLHFIDMAMEYADRIIGMRAGEVVFDGPASEVSEQTFEEIYGRKIREDDLVGGPEDE
ncbi:phosphonate ABC transporter ATP-binding protein [Alkalihalobacillus alcalophilus ATCC 27647 = CGMCC 1.3604]|uniref:Phosphonate ABC transporter ATP-binding protein n=1 Tax=Alkalihalobacillus alcalophilus ATCC 27647 = CGMCC 1.3604 TaxID=1218173 RepID=J8TJ79_ALKAL|nr:phosphonate ABC transporter ATP-binding protein [Alkalihalobacillus alcalophilus]AFV25810.1 phosphonate transporter [Alkalihalobacillus alcalophilus ATCC 27647 = CGMCC 1.3604]KGA97344.1 phosphonate ABC transporter ATP-binding protein [Alkalihalobacillus alcalophilus ATCC 27647 = CGMCC 1.3604]MED1560911.1 phosphonate ABC transporter ATP-binding protein [Alkalihalobacillus alcalophilus]THG90389.1 phosphonate ABC transporter ATP-binding protein [Alkalihalobacillus alcalophilus ATCC 27647 = CGMC